MFRCSIHSSGLIDLRKKVTVRLITCSPTTVNELHAKTALLVLHCSVPGSAEEPAAIINLGVTLQSHRAAYLGSSTEGTITGHIVYDWKSLAITPTTPGHIIARSPPCCELAARASTLDGARGARPVRDRRRRAWLGPRLCQGVSTEFQRILRPNRLAPPLPSTPNPAPSPGPMHCMPGYKDGHFP